MKNQGEFLNLSRDAQKRIAVINDFCGFGRCSIAVSLPIISAMKIQCCPIPTSIFSNHTGYDSFYYTDYTEHMDRYIDEWEKLGLNFDGILSGFLGSPEQIDIVSRFLLRFKTDKNVTVIDPVMGDGGGLYPTYSPLLAEKMCELVHYADILTPNLTEACILTKSEYREDIDDAALREICDKLCAMGPERIVISGLERDGDLANFIYEKGREPIVITEHKAGPCRAGTGDVFSSVIAADAVRERDLVSSVRHASSFVAKCLRRTSEMGLPLPDGVCFEEYLSQIDEI